MASSKSLFSRMLGYANNLTASRNSSRQKNLNSSDNRSQSLNKEFQEIVPDFDTVDLHLSEKIEPTKLLRVARGYHLRGNSGVARKLILSAAISSPEHIEEYDLMSEACMVSEPISSATAAAFDFLVVPSIRTGSSAVASLLQGYGEIALPSKSSTDDALTGDKLPELASKSASFRNARPAHRSGIVLHNYIPGNPLLLDSINWETYTTNICRVIDGNIGYQVVRDPVDLMVSLVSHLIITNQKIPFSQLGSPKNNIILGYLDAIDLSKPQTVKPRPVPPDLSLSDASREETKTACRNFAKMSTVDFGAIAGQFNSHFSQWRAVDISDLKKQNSPALQEKLEADIGLPHREIAPARHLPQNANINRFLYNLYVPCTFDGASLPLSIYLSDISLQYEELPFIELAWVTPTPEWTELGLPQSQLCLTTPWMNWVLIPADTRRRLLSNGVLEMAVEEIVLPIILDAWQAWTHAADPLIEDCKTEFAKWYASTELQKNRGQIDGFLDKQPHIAKQWTNYNRLVLGA